MDREREMQRDAGRERACIREVEREMPNWMQVVERDAIR